MDDSISNYGDSQIGERVTHTGMPLTGGGEPRAIVNCVRPAAFARAGHTIVYVACDPGTSPSLRPFDMVSERDRILGTLQDFPPDTPGISLAVSPDGKTVLFRVLLRGGADLMLIENFR
jgi:hypothetical protein